MLSGATVGFLRIFYGGWGMNIEMTAIGTHVQIKLKGLDKIPEIAFLGAVTFFIHLFSR